MPHSCSSDNLQFTGQTQSLPYQMSISKKGILHIHLNHELFFFLSVNRQPCMLLAQFFFYYTVSLSSRSPMLWCGFTQLHTYHYWCWLLSPGATLNMRPAPLPMEEMEWRQTPPPLTNATGTFRLRRGSRFTWRKECLAVMERWEFDEELKQSGSTHFCGATSVPGVSPPPQ